MRTWFPSLLSLGVSLALAVAVPASAEEIALVPKHRPGDSYLLTLGASTITDASSGGSVNKRYHERMEVDYEATVVILEVDAEGHPIRERHDDVKLAVQSTQGSGPVFEGDSSFEVHRDDGEITVLFQGHRADPKTEKAIVRVLETQFEHTLEPSLLDPGRPVAVGETWELDRSLAHELLWRRGVQVVKFGEPATATLAHRAGADGRAGLEIDYRIPISWLHADGLLPNAMAGNTEGFFGGTIRLASSAQSVPITRTSRLTLDVDGAVGTSGQPSLRPYPWSVRSSKIAEQTAARVEAKLSTPVGLPVPERPAR
jgi:hypothetical protein